MKPLHRRVPLLGIFAAILSAATVALAASSTRYIHVRVSNPANHELVRVNVPLMLAEKVIPAINHGELRNGKVHIGDFKVNDIDVRAILDALKTAPEGEFVTVQDTSNDVRVAKEHGLIVVHVTDKKGNENVDVTVPWEVAEALIADTTENQLNVEAAIKALERVGDMTLVKVSDHEETVRVWIDSRNAEE